MENKDLKENIINFVEENELNKIIYLCKKCSSPILIRKMTYYINKKKIYMECDCLCLRRKNVTIQDYIDEFEDKEYDKNINIVNNLKCFLPKNKTEFTFHNNEFSHYCTDCEQNLCLNCIGEIHCNHTLIIFDKKDLENLIDKIISLMNIKDNDDNSNRDENNEEDHKENDNNNEIKKFTIKDIDNKSKKALKEFLKKLNKFYSCHPCYNILQSVENIYKFCLNINIYINESSIYEPIEIIKEKKIRFPRELKNISESNKIISIKMIERGISVIKRLQNYDLSSLEILCLKKNNITDISPLANKNLDNLIRLHLEENKLGDDNIEAFNQLIAPKLKFINLFGNYFTSPDIFKCLKRFKNLERFYIGNNSFNDKFDDIYDCSTIIEAGFSLGVFSEETIEKLANFKFDNLKILYLNGNNIHSLECIEELKFDKLEEIWFMNNYIETFSQLTKFKNLKIINLKKNKIKDISRLDTFVKELPKLRKIIISNNKIDLRNMKNIEIIKNIRKGNIQIEIL